MKVTSFPLFENATVYDEQRELDILQKLIRLAADRTVFFGSYNDQTDKHDNGVYAYLLCNDTFSYACADAEEFEESDLDLIIDLNDIFSYHGVTAWMSKKRGYDPVKPYLTDKFYAARKYLEDLL